MKKIVSIFLIFVLCAGMAACSKSEPLTSGYEGLDFAEYIIKVHNRQQASMTKFTSGEVE